MTIDIIGYIASASVIIIYFGMTRHWWSPKVFDWGNAITVFPIGTSAILHGAYVPLVLTVTFGTVGWSAIITRYRNRPRKK